MGAGTAGGWGGVGAWLGGRLEVPQACASGLPPLPGGLTCTASPPPAFLAAAHWVKAPAVLLLHHNGRGFELELDPTGLPEGLHYTGE